MPSRGKARMKKFEPAVLTMRFDWSVDATNKVPWYIDLSQCASILNRRFYRQGLEWVVTGFELKNTGTTIPDGNLNLPNVTISKLQSTWVTANAWEKAFHHWKRQQDEALDDGGLESATARWRDFKIHMDDDHVQYAFSSNKRPRDNAGNLFLAGEWESTQIVIPNAANPTGSEVGTQDAEFKLKMYGASNASAKSIIDGYVTSR